MKKYSLDFISENDIKNNTKYSKIPSWEPEHIVTSEELSAYEFDMVISLTKLSLMFEGIELSENEIMKLKEKYYNNIKL